MEAAARQEGPGHNYLVEHSAGSGKSNTIGWLAHRLASLHDAADAKVFDSVIVITDRRILDDQIQKTIKQFMQVGATVGHAEHSGDLRRFIEQGKKEGATVHRISFADAVADGLYRRVCLRLGKTWTAEDEASWMAGVYAFYGDGAAEELDCIPSNGSGTR